MGKIRDLPDKDALFESNSDWFMHVLKNLDVDQRVALLMLLRRIWHVHISFFLTESAFSKQICPC
jgi:hypothetical protein